MLKHWLKNIRQKPKESRDRLAVTIAGVFTFTVLIVWVFNLPARSTAILETPTDEDSINIFSDMLKNISDQTSEIRETIELESALEAESSSSNAVDAGSGTSSTNFSSSTSSSVIDENASSTEREVQLQIIYSSSSVNNATTSGE